MSIRLRIAILAAFVLAVSIGVTSTLVTMQLNAQLRQIARTRVHCDADHIARMDEPFLVTGNKAALQYIAAKWIGDATTAVRVLDSRGRLIASAGQDTGGRAAALAAKSLQLRHELIGPATEITAAGVPVVAPGGRIVGSVGVTLRTDTTARDLRLVRVTALKAGLAAAILGLLLIYALLAVLIRSLRDIRSAILGIASGNYDRRLPANVPSELRVIAHAFNEMAEAVTERVRNLEVLNQLGAEISRSRRLSDIAKHLDAASSILVEARARLWVFNPRTDRLESVPAEGVGGRMSAHPFCTISIAAREMRTIYVGEDRELPPGSLICHALDPVDNGAAIPLTTPEGSVGAISVEPLPGSRQITKEGYSIAIAMANIVAPAVAARIRMESQTRSARLLQKVLAPSPPQKVPGIDIAAWYHPAEETTRMGGDYYDFIRLSDDTLCLAIGDVSGKGLPAAEYTMMVRYVVRSYILEYREPARAITLTNAALAAQMRPEAFITLFFGMLDAQTRRLRYANAGHPPPLVFSKSGEVKQLNALGVAAGLFLDVDYEEREQQFESGDTLVMYTDGLSEARANTILFEETQMMQTLSRCVDVAPSEMIKIIADDVHNFSGGRLHDDVAVVVVKFL